MDLDVPDPDVLNAGTGVTMCDYYVCGEVFLDGGFMCVIIWHMLLLEILAVRYM